MGVFPKNPRTWLIWPSIGLLCFARVLFLALRPEPILLRWNLLSGHVLKYKFTYSTDSPVNGVDPAPLAGDYVSYHSVLDVRPDGVATLFKADKDPVTLETVLHYKMDPLGNPYQMNRRGQVLRDREVYRREMRRVIKDMGESEFKLLFEKNEER